MEIKASTQFPNIAIVTSKEVVISDVQSALDLLATVNYQTGAEKMVIEKSAICEEFFDLRTGLAGEILQKFTNYKMPVAIAGDFSGYTSKALADFIRESNERKQVHFLENISACEASLGL